MRNLLTRVKKLLYRRLYSYLNRQALGRIKRNAGLWDEIEEYTRRSPHPERFRYYVKYLTLYNYVRTRKPKEILELGTGLTTVVMAYALIENEEEGGDRGRITSMEDVEKFYKLAQNLFPHNLKRLVDIRLSSKVEDWFSVFRGVRYKEIPERKYDFVFIDGPGAISPRDGQQTFDFDFIEIVARSEKQVSAVIDNRKTTCFALQNIFGREKVRFDYVRNIGHVAPCTKNDFLKAPQGILSL